MKPIEILIRKTLSRRPQIAVIGDVMCDEFVCGTVERFGQEAQVPVLRRQSATILPGGAGNLARQFRHWNANITLFALVDRPTEALLERHRISPAWCVRLGKGANPVKRRLFCQDQALIREDIERTDYGENELWRLRSKLFSSFECYLSARPDAVVLSDYAKGLFDAALLRRILDMSRNVNVPVLVDPHVSRAPADYLGCTLLKPNSAYAHRHGIERVYETIGASGGDVVLTKGPDPPEGTGRGQCFTCGPRSAVSARSVVGAGDCFAAHLALAAANNLKTLEAAELAYAAGRVYVQRNLNEPVLPREVFAHIDPAAAKAIGAEELLEFLSLRQPCARVVFTNGCFDLFHAGHLHTLHWARQQGDLLIVGINSDASVARLKGPGRPVMPLSHRIHVLAGLACVDWIISFEEDTPEQLIRTLRPRVLVKGAEYTGRRVVGDDLVEEVRLAPPSSVDYHSSDLLPRRGT